MRIGPDSYALVEGLDDGRVMLELYGKPAEELLGWAESRAREINDRIWPVKEAVYGSGEPSGDAHARMKEGMAIRGIFRSALARPPVLKPSADEIAAMRAALERSQVPRVDLS